MSAVARLLADAGITVTSVPTEDGTGWQLALVLDDVYEDDGVLTVDDCVTGLADLLSQLLKDDLDPTPIRVDAERVDLPHPNRNPEETP